LEAFLEDGQAMIDAIRDYVWSLEPPADQ